MAKTSKPSQSSPRNRSGRASRTARAGKTRDRRIVRLPYVKKIGQRGAIGVWQVDGSYVRTHTDEEFTNYGQHYIYPYIPEGEFWIDQGFDEEEISSLSNT